jgi:hypothetical protein
MRTEHYHAKKTGQETGDRRQKTEDLLLTERRSPTLVSVTEMGVTT